MPTYEYICKDCGHTFEIVQSMHDDSLTVCPQCGGQLRKVFAAPAISFKGSGFYATDHRKKGSSSTPDKTEKSDKTEKKDDKKADTKAGKGEGGGASKTTEKKPSDAKPAASSGRGGASSSSANARG
jgi:putative FmdB family regulatory protein